jgi:nucleotide-binding universal stress UspA family protein
VLSRTYVGFGMSPGMVDVEQIDTVNRERTEELAREGAQLANDAGLNAQPRMVSQERSIADAILAEADEVGASAIVMGSRGLTGVKSLLLGSVSHAVIQHADRAVVVVPSPEVATERAQSRRAEQHHATD